jgi:hypothetical protein
MAVTSVFSLVQTDLVWVFCTLPENADVFSLFPPFSYLLKFAPMGNDPPTVVSWGPGRLDLFLFDSGSHGSQFYHVWEQDNSAFQVEPLPIFIPGKGGIRSARAVSWGPGRLDVFVIAGDGYTVRTLEHLWYPDGNAFGSEVIDNNIMPYSTVAATTWPGRLDVFVGYGATESSPMHHFWQAKPVLKAPKHS